MESYTTNSNSPLDTIGEINSNNFTNEKILEDDSDSQSLLNKGNSYDTNKMDMLNAQGSQRNPSQPYEVSNLCF